MKALIIGYGSIGKRHESVLRTLPQISNIDVVTKQKLAKQKTFITLEDIDNLDFYDYFLICSETNKHFVQLKYLEKNVANKLIFCEKPLFDSNKDLKILNNKVFVGYVLRFHPIIDKLLSYLKDEHVILVKAICGQYLPSWRIGSDYKNSYSAKKEDGGGVLLDLSHEIDYVQLIAGEFKEIKSYQVKISDLEINSDDLTTLIGKTNNNVIVNISIDYISKITHRKLIVETLNATYELDFILNRLVKKDKFNKEEINQFSNLERNSVFKRMHLDILNNQKKVCSFDEGIKVMNTISIIQEQNNG